MLFIKETFGWLTSMVFVVKLVDRGSFAGQAIVKKLGGHTSIRNTTYAGAGFFIRESGEIEEAPGMGTPT